MMTEGKLYTEIRDKLDAYIKEVLDEANADFPLMNTLKNTKIVTTKTIIGSNTTYLLMMFKRCERNGSINQNHPA